MLKTHTHTEICTWMLISTIFIIAKNRSTNCSPSIQQTIIQWSEEMSYQVMKRQGVTWSAYYLVNESNLKRLCTIWVQLYDILKKAKLWRDQKYQYLPEVVSAKGWTGGAQRIFRAIKIPKWYIDHYNNGYVIIYLSKPPECTTPRVNTNVNYGL